MPKKITVAETDLAAIAKRYRIAAGRTRVQAADELGVVRQAVLYAEERPDKSFFKLRKRIIEKYSAYRVVGPVYWLEKG